MTLTVADKWPARFPDRLQLYSLPTPNGVKVSIMLEETGLAFTKHHLDTWTGARNTMNMSAHVRF